MFLVTKKDNTTFGGFSWGPGIENETDNPNFYFRVFESLNSAIYLSPFFGFEDYCLWSAEENGECLEERVCKRFSKVKAISQQEFCPPTREKRIVAAILCSMNLVRNKDFLDWCSVYLKENQNLDTWPQLGIDEIIRIKNLVSETDESSEYFSCAMPLLSSLTSDSVDYPTAASIFRSVSDSIDIEDPIDLDKILKIVSVVPTYDIVSIISH